MRATYSSTVLAAGGVQGTSGANWDGSQVNDEAAFFRAAALAYFARGNRGTSFGFRVSKTFESEAAAVLFCGLHFGTLPEQADLVLQDDAQTIQLRLEDAVIESVRPFAIRGVYVGIEYAFKGGMFVSEDVSDPDGGIADTMKTGVVDLSVADESKAVAFDAAFATPPKFVGVTISVPADGFAIAADVLDSSVAAAGFTARFGAAIPAAGYKLRWTAIL